MKSGLRSGVLESGLDKQLRYTPLNGNDETRFVEFESTLPMSQHKIHCKLVCGSLLDKPEYCALSYNWGPQDEPRAEIKINGFLLEIRKNLYEALLELRRRGVPRVWVDALSVNQSDRAEKGSQINMMDVIFGSARVAYAWLGPGVGSTDVGGTGARIDCELAMKTLGGDVRQSSARRLRYAVLQHLPGTTTPNLPESHRAIQSLLRRPYWRRVWIVQEITKPEKVEILCGKASVGFDKFVTNLLDLHEDSVHTLIPEEAMFVLNGLYRFYKQEHLRDRRAQMSLIDALLASRSSEATDDRDKIYALLALAHDSKRIIPIPNYVQRASTIFLNATTNMIQLERRISVILLARQHSGPAASSRSQTSSSTPRDSIDTTRVFASDKPSDRQSLDVPKPDRSRSSSREWPAPSWVPDWSDTDGLVAPWILSSIGKDSSEDAMDFDVPPTVDGAELSTPGLREDTIESVASLPIADPEGAAYLLQTLKMRTKLHIHRPRTDHAKVTLCGLWTALTLDQSPIVHKCDVVDCAAKDSGGAHAVATLFTKGSQSADASFNLVRQWFRANEDLRIDGTRLQDLVDSLLGEHKSSFRRKRPFCAGSFIEEAKVLTHGLNTMTKYKMRLAVTSNGKLRVAYREASKGDEICRLQGCPLAVILRPKGVKGWRSYNYVGEVFASGKELRASPCVDADIFPANGHPAIKEEKWDILTIR